MTKFGQIIYFVPHGFVIGPCGKRDAGHAAPTFTAEAPVLSFKKLLAAVCLAAATWAPQAAHATTFLTFSQTGDDPIVATRTGSSTHITMSDSISISVIDATGYTLPMAGYMTISAQNDGPATLGGNGYASQNYSGTFSITNGGSTNFLSGTFNDALVSGKSTGGTFTASQPPANELSFTSNVISGADLAEVPAMSLAFTNINAPISIVSNKIGRASCRERV